MNRRWARSIGPYGFRYFVHQHHGSGDADVINVATIAAGVGGLIVADIYAQDGFAILVRAKFDSDLIPGVHFQVIALVGRVYANAVLVYCSRITQVGIVIEDQVYGDTGTVAATD